MTDLKQEAQQLFDKGLQPAEIAKELIERGLAEVDDYQLLRSKVKGWYRRRANKSELNVDDVDKMLAGAKEKQIIDNQKKVIADLLKRTAQLDIIADKIVSAINVLPELEFYPIKVEHKANRAEEEVILLLSDIQGGTYISKEATGGLNEYNFSVFEKQILHLLNGIASIVMRHREITTIKRLHIFKLGDIVEGIDIYVGQAQHVDQDLYNQIFKLADKLCWLIVELLNVFEEIVIDTVPGNHGRVGKKGENPHWVNWDNIVYKYMEAKLQNYNKVKWNITLSWWQVVDVLGKRFLLNHGDGINGYNGIPFYGINRAVSRYSEMLPTIDVTFDYACFGHFHTPTELPRMNGEIFINGCWTGGSILALKDMNTTSRPMQKIMGVHPEYGVTWRYPIWL